MTFNSSYSDGFVLAGEALPKGVLKAIDSSGKPVLSYKVSQDAGAVVDFIQKKYCPNYMQPNRIASLGSLVLIVFLSIIGCDKEFHNVGIDLFENYGFQTQSETYPVFVYQEALEKSTDRRFAYGPIRPLSSPSIW